MKKLIFTVLTMLVLASNAYSNMPREFFELAQDAIWLNMATGKSIAESEPNLNEQQFKIQFELRCLLFFFESLSRLGAHRDIRHEYNAAKRIRIPGEMLKELRNMRNRYVNQCRGQNSSRCAEINDRNKIHNALMTEINSEWQAYKVEIASIRQRQAELEAQAEKERKEKEARQREQWRVERIRMQFARSGFASYDSIVRAINLEGGRGEFETTSEHNQRLKDSSEVIFKRVAFRTYQRFADDLRFNNDCRRIRHRVSVVNFGRYNADKEELVVIFNGDSGTIIVSPSVAQELRAETNNSSGANLVYTYDHFFFHDRRPVFRNFRIGIKGRNEMYKVSFSSDPRISDDSVFAFRGSELWADNPYVENLVITFKELGEMFREDTERRDAWANKIRRNINEKSTLVLKLPDRDIKFEVGKPFPVRSGHYVLQDKEILFKCTYSTHCREVFYSQLARDCFADYREGFVRLIQWQTKGKNSIIRQFSLTESFFDLGYGIWDIE